MSKPRTDDDVHAARYERIVAALKTLTRDDLIYMRVYMQPSKLDALIERVLKDYERFNAEGKTDGTT